jgi:glutamyl-tRNA synthetase
MKTFEAMLEGKAEGWCIRAKMNMQNKFKCLRDPVFYRCKVDVPHHRHGTKYKAYPTYDFACPIVDALEGITHAMRTVEYHDRNDGYHWVQKVLDLRSV